ncbi:MAG: hypothetical protein P8P74_14655 [Crocinitomicaceae bacterium]|nr:hypothetical protein [Crocinitomicaceae bacterium]
MKELKPQHVLFFLLGLMLVLSPVVYFMPEDGVKVGRAEFDFMSKEDFFHPKKQENADVDDIFDMDTSVNAKTPVRKPLKKHKNGSNGNMGAPGGGSYEVESLVDFQMTDAGKSNLHQFFTKLSSAASQQQRISILHYGDSQIEGDRITGFVRERIQNQFGGNGPGMIPATNVYDTYAFNQTFSENFKRYTSFGGASLKSRKYGAMASASRFTPEYVLETENSLDSLELEEQTGWIEVGPSGRARSRARSFNNVRMHYNSCIAPTMLRVYQNGEVIHEDSLIMDGGQHTVLLTFPSTPGPLKFEFKAKISPNICAFSLEGDYGVQVSNIGMRGSSGTVWGRMNHGNLATMYREVNTKMVIMQFGGNSVPSFKDSASVRNFAGYFKGQINAVKRLNPGAMVIVIGPSDMSKYEEGLYNTYPLLPYCIDRMIAATKETGSAYWNLYAAMGGYNSMPAWVEKGMAGSDYIHFSGAGTKFAAQMFYNSLMVEYNSWKGQ